MLVEILYIIFGISVFGIFWTYVGYPLFIFILSKFFKKEHKFDENYQPNVSIIIPCYNEENVMEKKLKNILDLNYPKEKTEILVVDDGSLDNTTKIVENFAKHNKIKNITLLFQERMGKNAAINNGFKYAKNAFVAISDANTFLDKNALKYCLRHFSDDTVGGVSARIQYKIYTRTGESVGASLYQKIEDFLFEKENQIGYAHYSSGWLQAFRKNLLNPNEDRPFSAEDWDLGVSIKQKKHKVIYEPLAISQKYAVSSGEDLFNQRLRAIIGGIEVLVKNKNLLNPLKWGIFSLIFFSNKPIQIMSPFLIMGIFFSSLSIYFLTSNVIFYYLVSLKILVFFIGFITIITSSIKEIDIQPFPTIKFFTLMNIICLIAWFNYFRGDYGTTWETVKSSRNI